MKKYSFILVLLIIAISFAVIFNLYQRIYPVGALRLESDRAEITEKARTIAAELNLKSEAFVTDISLRQRSNLLRYLQEKFGLQKSNQLIQSRIPAFYYTVTWYPKNAFPFASDSDDSGEKFNAELFESLKMAFDTRGSLLSLKWTLPDTMRLNLLSREQARAVALSFLNRHTPYKTLIEDSARVFRTTSRQRGNITLTLGDDDEKAGQETETSDIQINSTEHEFTFKSRLAELDKEIYLKISVAGNLVSGLEVDYDLPERDENIILIITKIALVLAFFILIILALIEGFQRFRSYEIGFKMAIILGGVIALGTLLEVLSQIRLDAGYEFLFAVILGPLFMGAAFVVMWALCESLGRDLWQDKFVSLDLLTKGYLQHSAIGKSIIRGTAFGSVAFALMLALVWVFDYLFNLTFNFENRSLLSLFTVGSPVFYQLGHSLVVALNMLVSFIILFLSILKKRLKLRWLYMTVGALVFSLYFSDNIFPIHFALFIYIIVGLIFIITFYRYDVLTAFFALFTFMISRSGIGLFSAGNADLITSGWILGGGLMVILIYSITTLFTRDASFDQNRIAPAFTRYINERQRLQRELEIARDVQMGFLPDKMPDFSRLDIAARCLPALEVGGDYYDFIRLKENKYAIAIGDVSGKGTQAAFYMTLTKGFLNALARYFNSAAEVLKAANRLFYENARRNTFISMVYCVFDLNKKQLVLARAGHNPVIMRRIKIGKVEKVIPTGLALGLDKGEQFNRLIRDVTLPVEKGDLFILYTDGLTEAMNKYNKEWGESRLFEIAEQFADQPAEDILNRIFQTVHKFVGKAVQHDDMSVIVIKVL